MAQVSIVMGSDSDMPVMAKAADILDRLGISYEMRIISAHREPDLFFEYAKTAEARGVKDGCSSARYVRGNFSHARNWHSDAYHVAGRTGFPVFHCTDACRHSGCDGCHRRWCERRAFGGQDTGGFGYGPVGETQGIFTGAKRGRRGKRCPFTDTGI